MPRFFPKNFTLEGYFSAGIYLLRNSNRNTRARGGFRAAATSKMFQLLSQSAPS